MAWYSGIADAAKYLIETGTDIYKTTLDAKTAQKTNEAAAEVAKAKADDLITIGGYEISVTKALMVVVGAMGLLWLTTMSKVLARKG